MQSADQRKRELLQILQALYLVAETRVDGALLIELAQLQIQLRFEASQSPLPAFHSADHRGVYQQGFPADRRLQRTVDDRIGRTGLWPVQSQATGLRHDKAGEQLVIYRNRAARIAYCPRRRNLAERKILAEASRRTTLARATEQRQKSSPRGVRPHHAAAEMRGDSGAPQRLLEKRLITLRIAQQNGHPVERNPGGPHAPRDFDGLHALARSGKIVERLVALIGLRRLRR